MLPSDMNSSATNPPDEAMMEFVDELWGAAARMKIQAIYPDAKLTWWRNTSGIACGKCIVIPSRPEFIACDEYHFGKSDGWLWEEAYRQMILQMSIEFTVALLREDK